MAASTPPVLNDGDRGETEGKDPASTALARPPEANIGTWPVDCGYRARAKTSVSDASTPAPWETSTTGGDRKLPKRELDAVDLLPGPKPTSGAASMRLGDRHRAATFGRFGCALTNSPGPEIRAGHIRASPAVGGWPMAGRIHGIILVCVQRRAVFPSLECVPCGATGGARIPLNEPFPIDTQSRSLADRQTNAATVATTQRQTAHRGAYCPG